LQASSQKFALINAAGLALRTLTIPPVNAWLQKLLRLLPISTFDLSAQALSRNLALAVILPITLILNTTPLTALWYFR
jgi:hypothetical protein